VAFKAFKTLFNKGMVGDSNARIVMPKNYTEQMCYNYSTLRVKVTLLILFFGRGNVAIYILKKRTAISAANGDFI